MSDYGSYTYNTTIEVQFLSGGERVEWEVSIEMKCTYPGDPGRQVGPPEECYPPEGAEFEWERVHLFVGEHTILDTDKIKGINKQQRLVELVIGDRAFIILDLNAQDAASENWEPREVDHDY